MSKISFPTLIIAGLVVLVLLTFAFTYQVDFNEVAVKAHFGKADASSVIREPGLKFRWPYPFESIETYDVRLRPLDTPETEIKTIDGKMVIVGAYVVWQITDPLKFYVNVPERSVAGAEKLMRPIISQSQAAVIGQATLADFVNLDVQQKDANYDRLLAQMLDGVKPRLAPYGIDVRRVGLRRISLPKEAMQQVFASMQQERNRLAARYRQEGKSRAEGIKARADANAQQIMAFANRRAKEIESAGIAASTQILKKIQQEDAGLFILLRELDALRESLSQKTTIFLDQKSPLFAPFVHPPTPPEPSKTAAEPAPQAAAGS
jgi:membrane protease subunit HflC